MAQTVIPLDVSAKKSNWCKQQHIGLDYVQVDLNFYVVILYHFVEVIFHGGAECSYNNFQNWKSVEDADQSYRYKSCGFSGGSELVKLKQVDHKVMMLFVNSFFNVVYYLLEHYINLYQWLIVNFK